ncbi:MAG: LamG domain-containing protein [Gammaproteobacteria bacterium]|nr:MAG: LamG domain-containing protein [Gammaproteobacteria bacterium]
MTDGYNNYSANTSLRVGKQEGNVRELYGTVFNACFYNKELSSSEISQLYANGLGRYNVVSPGNILFETHNPSWQDYVNSNNGTLNGTQTRIKVVDSRFSFAEKKANNGELILNADGYELITDDATLDITSAITLEAWVKPFTVSTLQSVIGKNNAYALNITATGAVQFQRWSGTTSGTVDSTTTLSAYTWYHIAATYDGTTTKIYINGSEDKSATSLSGAIDSVADDLLVGALTSSTQLYSGYIDSAKVYDSALTATQILTNYQAESEDHQN